MTITTLVPITGTAAACRAVGQPRSSWYRAHRSSPPPPRPPPRPQPRALSPAERQQVLGVLHAERFWDAAPATVYATLLDEGCYLCSPSTMYRLLRAPGETGDRRRRATHPPRVKPDLLATRPNQCWSWDITKLAGPAIAAQGVAPGQLTIHADRGASMTSKPVAMLLADLGITRSHSRPHVSNDNPYSESQLKTLKHHPTFPARFGCIQDARGFCQQFFAWYNLEPPQRDRAADPRRRPPRPRRADHPGARRDAGGRLRRPPSSGSSASHPSHLGCPRPCGSTNASTQRSCPSNFPRDLSHRG
jgi:putative transposase